MKKFEIIAIVVLVIIAAICIPIFIVQLINSDTDVPVFSVSNSTNDTVDNSVSNNIEDDDDFSSESTNNTSNNLSDFFDITEPPVEDIVEEDIPKKPTFFDITEATDNSNTNSNSPDDEFTVIVDEGNSSETQNNILDLSSTLTSNDNDSSVTISYLTEQAATFPYYIKVNVAANTITVYSKDESGNYTIPHKAFICSTGTATPHSRYLCYTSKI